MSYGARAAAAISSIEKADMKQKEEAQHIGRDVKASKVSQFNSFSGPNILSIKSLSSSIKANNSVIFFWIFLQDGLCLKTFKMKAEFQFFPIGNKLLLNY